MQRDPADRREGAAPATGMVEEFVPRRPFASLLSTTRDVLLSPRRFFGGLPPDGPIGPPVLYFSVCYWIATLVNLLVSFAVSLPLLAPVLVAVGAGSSEAGTKIAGLLALAFLLLLAFLAISALGFALFFVGVPIQHAFVVLFAGSGGRGLRATLRLSCYAVGAPVLLAWIPLVGYAAALYCFYVYVVGLKRVHGISTARALAAVLVPVALFAALAATGLFLGYKALREAVEERPVSYYYPPPETLRERTPPGVFGAAALTDGNRDQGRLRELRYASYSDERIRADARVVVTVLTADPEDYPKGVRGSASKAGGESLGIDPGETASAGGMRYDVREVESRSPEGYYEEQIVQPTLVQELSLPPGGAYTVDLEQVGREPRLIRVNAYSDEDPRESVAYFGVPFRLSEPGTRLRLETRPGLPLDGLRLEVDRDGDGLYEESWMPEATLAGGTVFDGRQPVTTPRIEEDPASGDPLLILEAVDGAAPGLPPSGIGVTYYWIDDSGPRIYTGPVPVEAGDAVTYWSADRGGNAEWRRTTDVLRGTPPAGR